MIALLARPDVREALELTRLLDRILRESKTKDDDWWFGPALRFTFTWALPACAPLLTWRGEYGLMLVFGVEHVLFVVCAALWAAIDDVPKRVRDAAARRHFLLAKKRATE